MPKPAITAVVAGVVGAMLAVPVAVYASHSFNDVPDTSTFHADIAWLAEAGVTRGCNPPANTEFCPEDEVSRGQMAAFMRRFAQYLDAEDGTPAKADHADTADSASTADDADKVDGFDASSLVPIAVHNFTDNAPDRNFTLETEITIPATGVVILSGAVDAANVSAEDDYHCELRVIGVTVPGSVMGATVDGDAGANESENCTTTGATVLGADTYTVDLNVFNVAPTTDFLDASVWALWIPSIEG